MREDLYQLRFDGGHQQRYFADRASLLGCVLRVSKHSPHPRFEIWRQGPPVLLKDGRVAGTRYELVEVLDARDGDLRRRVLDELHALDAGQETGRAGADGADADRQTHPTQGDAEDDHP